MRSKLGRVTIYKKKKKEKKRSAYGRCRSETSFFRLEFRNKEGQKKLRGKWGKKSWGSRRGQVFSNGTMGCHDRARPAYRSPCLLAFLLRRYILGNAIKLNFRNWIFASRMRRSLPLSLVFFLSRVEEHALPLLCLCTHTHAWAPSESGSFLLFFVVAGTTQEQFLWRIYWNRGRTEISCFLHYPRDADPFCFFSFLFNLSFLVFSSQCGL